MRKSPFFVLTITTFCIFLAVGKDLTLVDLVHIFGHKVRQGCLNWFFLCHLILYGVQKKRHHFECKMIIGSAAYFSSAFSVAYFEQMQIP